MDVQYSNIIVFPLETILVNLNLNSFHACYVFANFVIIQEDFNPHSSVSVREIYC
jgi:hypothetical protein